MFNGNTPPINNTETTPATESKNPWQEMADEVLGKNQSTNTSETSKDAAESDDYFEGVEYRNIDKIVILPNNDESSAETAENGEIDPKIISKIDEYMMSSSEDPYMMARYVADLTGVAAGIKPTALIQTMETELNIDNAILADLIKQSGLCIADGWENGHYFVSKDINLANQVKEKFHKLWNNTITDSENRDLGRLLGYPETAVAQDFKKHKRTLEKIRKVFAKDSLERHYTHSPEHQDEEFESYEKPIHEYMEEYCPRATALLKDERSSYGKKFRWL